MKTKKSTKPAASKPTTPKKAPSIGPLIDRLQATIPDGRAAFLEATGAKLVLQVADYYGLDTAGKLGATIRRIVEHLEKVDRQAAEASERAHGEDQAADAPTANAARDGAPVDQPAPIDAPPPAGANTGEPGANDAPPVELPAVAPTANRRRAAPKPPKEPKARDERLPPAGTVLQKKDRHGTVRCECTIQADGIRYKDTIFTSLSSAAMAAAKDLGLGGKTQNGFAFWGITKPTARAARRNPVESLSKVWERYREGATVLVKGASADDRAKLHEALTAHATALLEIAATVAPAEVA